MKNLSRLLAVLVFGGAVALAGCKKEENKDEGATSAEQGSAKTEASGDEATGEPAGDPAAGANEGEADDDAVAAVKSVMDPYERCRALLAGDTAEGIDSCAQDIAKAAEAGAGDVSEGAKKPMADLATAAQELAGAPKDDLAAVRLAFGDVSKAAVALLSAAPSAAVDYHVFECPMAKGYKRWAQTSAEMANPYMGEKMLQCGSEVHDHHQGMQDEHPVKGDHMDGHMR